MQEVAMQKRSSEPQPGDVKGNLISYKLGCQGSQLRYLKEAGMFVKIQTVSLSNY
jgi:hypothetical protein